MIDPARITGYHAHIYYDEASRERAARIREFIEGNFKVVMGRWRDTPVGPHPQAMYQVAFGAEEFPRIVPWLMLNRDGLTVLVHPENVFEIMRALHRVLLDQPLREKMKEG